ncbi:MAG: hypothetical protein M1831_007160 [Alyxoria varia]|nr:MAG: hypothetical protein M1831_007160 [Alyxoria varia]
MHSNAAAWIVEAKSNPVQVKEAPYSSPDADEVVIKNGAFAINPVDWKLQDTNMFPQDYPAIFGDDVAGEVVEVGGDVKDVKKGDRVMGHCIGLITKQPKHGAFQNYSVVKGTLTSVIPSSVAYKDAAVLPLAISTAAAGLYQPDKLALPSPSVPPKSTGTALLVWGGSSSVGTCTIQLAVASGVEVITTASKRNHDLCKKLGASQVFDYSSPTIVDELVDAFKGKEMAGAYDSISEHDTLKACAEVVGRSRSIKKYVAAVIPPPKEDLPYDVQCSNLMAPTILGDGIGHTVWHEFLPMALEKGTVVPAPGPLVLGHGLQYTQAAMNKSKEGLSAAKAVVTL